jgi:hypothetical protein
VLASTSACSFSLTNILIARQVVSSDQKPLMDERLRFPSVWLGVGGGARSKKLSFTTPELELERRKVTFCAVWINEATRMNAADVARGLILDANKRKSVTISCSS